MEFVTVHTAYDEAEAEIVKLALEAAGVNCVLENAHQAGLTGILAVKVQVKSEDEQRARQLLENRESGDET